jgi:hypothetical protein
MQMAPCKVVLVALLLALPSEKFAAPMSSAANRARQRRQRERQRNTERAQALTAQRREAYAALPEQEHAAPLSVVDRTLGSLQLPAQEVVVWAAQRRGVQGGAAPLNGNVAQFPCHNRSWCATLQRIAPESAVAGFALVVFKPPPDLFF